MYVCTVLVLIERFKIISVLGLDKIDKDEKLENHNAFASCMVEARVQLSYASLLQMQVIGVIKLVIVMKEMILWSILVELNVTR